LASLFFFSLSLSFQFQMTNFCFIATNEIRIIELGVKPYSHSVVGARELMIAFMKTKSNVFLAWSCRRRGMGNLPSFYTRVNHYLW
jgi:hypothetical protein